MRLPSELRLYLLVLTVVQVGTGLLRFAWLGGDGQWGRERTSELKQVVFCLDVLGFCFGG